MKRAKYISNGTITYKIIGDQGPQGIQGPQGDAGKSAYQIAVDNGFEGTEEEWLASLSVDLVGNSNKFISDGNLLLSSLFDFEVGGLYSEETKPLENFDHETWRIRSKKIVTVSNDLTIKVCSGFKIAFRHVIDGVFDKDGTLFLTNTTETIPSGNYRIMIQRDPETSSGIADINEYLESVSVITNTASAIADNASAIADNASAMLDGKVSFASLFGLKNFEIGGISGISDNNQQTWRVRSKNYIKFDFDIGLSMNDGYRMICHAVVDNAYDESQSFDVTQSVKIIPKDVEYRVCIVKNDVSSGNADINLYLKAVNLVSKFNRLDSDIDDINKKLDDKAVIPWEIEAHQGEQYSSGIFRGNMTSNMFRAIDVGAKWIEIDVRQTKDDVLVLCHDEYLTIDSVTYKIDDTDYETLSALVLETDPKYGEQHIGLLSNFINISKRYNLNLALDVKLQNTHIIEDIAKMVVSMGMSGRVAYNCTPLKWAKTIMSIDSKALFHCPYVSDLSVYTEVIPKDQCIVTMNVSDENLSINNVINIRKDFKFLLWGVSSSTSSLLYTYYPDIAEYGHNTDIKGITENALSSIDSGIIN